MHEDSTIFCVSVCNYNKMSVSISHCSTIYVVRTLMQYIFLLNDSIISVIIILISVCDSTSLFSYTILTCSCWLML